MLGALSRRRGAWRQHIRHSALSHQPSQLQRHILRLRGELHALEGANCSSSSEEGSARKLESPRARLQSPRTNCGELW